MGGDRGRDYDSDSWATGEGLKGTGGTGGSPFAGFLRGHTTAGIFTGKAESHGWEGRGHPRLGRLAWHLWGIQRKARLQQRVRWPGRQEGGAATEMLGGPWCPVLG